VSAYGFLQFSLCKASPGAFEVTFYEDIISEVKLLVLFLNLPGRGIPGWIRFV
jgi:hypothetical protein